MEIRVQGKSIRASNSKNIILHPLNLYHSYGNTHTCNKVNGNTNRNANQIGTRVRARDGTRLRARDGVCIHGCKCFPTSEQREMAHWLKH